jgi:hypothetical protein
VSAFTGENIVSLSIPIQASFAQTGSGGDHCLVSNGCPLHAIQGNQVLLAKARNAPGIGLQVIDQHCRGKLEFAGQARGLDCPGKVRRLYLAVADGAGHAEARDVGMGTLLLYKISDNLIQAAELLAGKHAFRRKR